MKLRQSLCCVLLCVFTFFVVFSVSAFAYTVNGYEVTTDYAVGDSSFGPLQYTEFNTTIIQTATGSALSIRTDIDLSEPINENAIFDLRLNFDYGSASSITATYHLKDSDGVSLLSGETSIYNKQLILEDLIADGDIYFISIYFSIDTPVWNEVIINQSPDNITDLTNTKWYVPEGWSVDKGFGKFTVTGEWNSNSSSTVYPFTEFFLGGKYVTGGYSSVADCVGSLNNGSNFYNVTDDGFYVAFTGGSSVTNTSLISWLKTYGEFDGYIGNDDYTSSTVEYTYNFTVTDLILNITDSGEQYSGIIGWIKNVFNSITNLPSRIGNSLSNFFTNLGNKITDLGASLLEGIKSLFIPSEEGITELKSKFESLLDDRFGAVYDSANIIDDFANSFNSSATTSLIPGSGGGENSGVVSSHGTVSFPSITVNLVDVPFTFGGWEVQLKYDGFEFIYDSLILITNICATFLFVNAMKQRLEGVLR